MIVAPRISPPSHLDLIGDVACSRQRDVQNAVIVGRAEHADVDDRSVDVQRAVVGAQLGVVAKLDIGGDRAEAEQSLIDQRAKRAGAGDRPPTRRLTLASVRSPPRRFRLPAAATVAVPEMIGAGAPDAVAADRGSAGHVEVGTLNAAAAEHAADGVDVEDAVGSERPFGVRDR